MTGRHRVVVVGGGFGGLYTTRALADVPVDMTLVTGPTTTSSSPCCTRSPPACSPRA